MAFEVEQEGEIDGLKGAVSCYLRFRTCLVLECDSFGGISLRDHYCVKFAGACDIEKQASVGLDLSVRRADRSIDTKPNE